MSILYIDMQGKAPQTIQGDRSLAEKLAAYMFDHDSAAKLIEDISPTGGYTGRVYTITRGDDGHRQETLLYRVSTVGPKPQIGPRPNGQD